MKSRISIAPVNVSANGNAKSRMTVNVNVARRGAELSGRGWLSGVAGGRIKQKCPKSRAPYRSAAALTNDTP
jgi:hypothetical protein